MGDFLGRGATADVVTPAGTWQGFDPDFDGTDTVLGQAPATNVYGPFTNGWNARLTRVRSSVRVRVPNCRITADILTLEANAILDGDGNPGSGTTAGTAINNGAGDLFAGVPAGAAGVSVTGQGGASGGSGGNSMGGAPGYAKPAGAQAARATTYTNVASATNRGQFHAYGAVYGHLHNFAQTTIASINTGNSGPGGTCNTGTGTASSGASGSPGVPVCIRARRLEMGANSRISSRGGAGAAGVATGDGIGTGAASSPGGWLDIEVDEWSADATAVIDCECGLPGAGSSTPTGDGEYGAPGTVRMFVGGKPAPRQRVMFVGDSRMAGSTGDVNTVGLGGPRGWALYQKRWGCLPWLPVGGQRAGNFGPAEMLGQAGEKIADIKNRLVVDAAQYLAPIPGWPRPIVVMDVGANDITAGTAWAAAGPDWTTALDAIWTANVDTLVIVAKVYDINGSTAAKNTYNTNLTTLLQARSEWNTKLYQCDLDTALGAYSATYWADNTHLNAAGQRLVANAIRSTFTTLGV